MDRNRLKGVEGDQINAILSAGGMNFWKLLKRVTFYAKISFGFNIVKEKVFAKFLAKYEFFRIDYSDVTGIPHNETCFYRRSFHVSYPDA
jgi:hypothetical protein